MIAQAIAKGKVKGHNVVIKCTKERFGSPVRVIITGCPNKKMKEEIRLLIGDDEQKFLFLKGNADPVPLYNPKPGTVEAYLNAIYLNDVFDGEMEFSTKGQVNVFGAGFDNSDDSKYDDVVF